MFAVRRKRYQGSLGLNPSAVSSSGGRLVTAGNQLHLSPDREFLATPHVTTVWDLLPQWSALGGRKLSLPHPHSAQQSVGEGCLSGARGKVTHQVHDEVQLDGEVHDEEDAGPGVPGVGGHHHIWKTVFAECYPQGPCLLVSVFYKDTSSPALPAPSPLPYSWLTRPLPSLMGSQEPVWAKMWSILG